MKTCLLIPALALTAACMADTGMDTAAAADAEAEALAGRTAGEPMSCVSLRDLGNNRSLGENAILFDGPGDLVYLNRPSGGCRSLDFGRALTTRTTSGQLCRGDIAHVFDPATGIEYGGCALGDFVPYRRAGG